MFAGVPYMKEKVKRASVVTFSTVESVYILFLISLLDFNLDK
jgi:hypothetical protein